MNFSRASALSFMFAAIGVLHAREATTASADSDKSGYTLFNPTPRERMREFNTDQPDMTESPYTVDAGHFQVEADLLNYTHDRDRSEGGDRRLDSLSVATVNLKVGLLNDVDLQCILETWRDQRLTDRATGVTEKAAGFGDVTVRLKDNFWGNDSGATAFGFMPFVKLPSAHGALGNGAVEGGAIFPLAVKLAEGWDLGLMTEIDFLRNDGDNGYHASYVNSVTVGHEITESVGCYLEFFSEVDERAAGWVGTVDFGFSFAVTDNLKFDTGVNIGVTRAAPDWNPFVGVSYRH